MPGVKVIVGPAAEFEPGERRIVKAGGRSIGVFRFGDEFFAVRNRCPHQGGPLCLGRSSPWLRADAPGEFELDEDAYLIACPWHGWEYDLRTGQSFMGPGETRVKAYNVSVAAGRDVSDPAPAVKELEIPANVRTSGRIPGPYVAETFPVYVDDEYLVVIEV